MTRTGVPEESVGSGGSGRHLRLSDAERDSAAQALAEHYVAGRLDADELEERQQRALLARFQAELPELFADLPGGPPVEVSPSLGWSESHQRPSARSSTGSASRRTPQGFPMRSGGSATAMRVLMAIFLVTVVINTLPFLIVLLGAFWLLSHVGRSRPRGVRQRGHRVR